MLQGARRGRLIELALVFPVPPCLAVLFCLAILLWLPLPADAGQTDGRLSVLDVPFISQTELLCGGAAAAMVLRYWGARDLTAESFAHLVDRRRDGIPTDALISDVARRGWQAVAVRGTDERLNAEVAAGRPVIALVEDRRNAFHYVVIVATTSSAVVFHDPARTPFRVMSRDAFSRRWESSDRWMAVIARSTALDTAVAPEVVPPPAPTSAPAIGPSPPLTLPSTAPVPSPNRCETLVADGVRLAQAKDLQAAERTLTSALSCPGSAPLRELGGVRVLQGRWPDATELAAAAVREDARDDFAWRLLATGRFLQDERGLALEAWNVVGEPRIDLVRVAGLTRTRSGVVEGAVGVAVGDVLTPTRLRRGQRLVAEVPSLVATSLDYVPVPAGRAEVRSTVTERPLLPSTPISWAAIGIAAAVAREVKVATGSLFGGGERVGVYWRYWPGRPRIAVDLQAPTGWHLVPGAWGVSVSQERQPFDTDAVPTSERFGGRFMLSSWATSSVRWAVRAGADEWRGRGRFAVLGGGLRVTSAADRVVGQVDVDGWTGVDRFSVLQASARVRSSGAHEGFVITSVVGAGLATAAAPADLWFAGDTGRARPILLRAHPVIGDGRLRSSRLGRGAIHGSVEAQRWWRVPMARVGGAVFADAASVRSRVDAIPLGDLDLGAGLRATVPGMSGVVRIDLAKGLRDGATRLSFVYEP